MSREHSVLRGLGESTGHGSWVMLFLETVGKNQAVVGTGWDAGSCGDSCYDRKEEGPRHWLGQGRSGWRGLLWLQVFQDWELEPSPEGWKEPWGGGV